MTSQKKKILMIIAPRDFRDEEYFVPAEIFARSGFQVETASSALGIAYGKLGGEVKVTLLLEQVAVAQFEAVVFVGGPGATKYFDDPEIKRIISDSVKQKKLLAAICIAPVILAKAGVLSGKKATVWTSALDKSAVRDLEAGGAHYLEQDVVREGDIITASGPDAAQRFAQTIIERIAKKTEDKTYASRIT